MASFTVDPSVPQNTENESLGASRIRNLAGWLNAMFGQSTTAAFAYLQQPFNLDTAGLPQVLANPTTPLGIASKQYVDGSTGKSGTITNGGAGSAFTGTLSPAITSYVNFTQYVLGWVQASQGNDTVNLNGLGAVTVKKNVGGVLVNLAAGDVPAGSVTVLVYDGLYFELVGGPIPIPPTPVARVIKPTDQTVSSSIALVSDTALLFAIAASESWEFQFNIYSTYSVSGGLDIAVTSPAGASIFYNATPTQAGVFAGSIASGTKIQIASGTGGGGTEAVSRVVGTVVNGATPGNITLQFTQDASTATATALKANSSLLAWRLNP